MNDTDWVLAASIAFVGTHFVLSHSLRARLTTALGEKGFAAVYSIIALVTFVWMIVAYRAAPTTSYLWGVGDGLWVAATVVMLIASMLMVGSLVGNPALPSGGRQVSLPSEARGVFSVTRHPMLWAFALWGIVHIAIFPVLKNIIVSAAIIVLALVGAHLQDIKKRKLQPALWPTWEERTSYWPFIAMVTGRARFTSVGWHTLVGGVALWMIATWAHIPAAGIAAGVWRWIG